MWCPIPVLEQELTLPLAAPPSDLRPHRKVNVLLRWRGSPVGRIDIPVAGSKLASGDLVERILDTYLDAITRWAVTDALRAEGPLTVPEIVNGCGASALDDHDAPSVSVIICTRERPEDLERCLGALEVASPRPLEVIVVDNAPATDATRRIAERFSFVRYTKEPRPGLDWARNRGMLEARGDIVAFADDDVVVDRAWVGAIARAFRLHPSAGAVTGLIAPFELATSAQFHFELHAGFGRGFLPMWEHHPVGGPLPWRGLATGALGSGANMAFRRKLFDHMGLFLPQLDAGTVTEGGGDLEILYRTLKFGYPIAYDPRVFVWHRHRREAHELSRQIQSWGIATIAMLECVSQQFPDEAANARRYAWYWRQTLLKRALSQFLRPPRVPYAIRLNELRGVLIGKQRYQAALEEVRRIEREFGPQPGVSTLADRSRLPAPRGWDFPRRMAVRSVDVSRGIHALEDVEGYLTTRVFIHAGRRPLGHVDVENRGLAISRERLVDRMLETRAPIEWVALFNEVSVESARAQLRTLLTQQILPADDTPSSFVSWGQSTRASIVLATRDRPVELRRCLASLTRVTREQNPEILVVDNHPASPATAEVTRDFSEVTLVREPRQGLSYARNAGFARASGDVVVCTDDDVIFADDWLAALLRPFHRNDIDIVCGNVLPVALETESQLRFEQYGGLGKGFDAFEVDQDWFFRDWRRSVETWTLGATANTAFRSSLLRDPDVGRFEEALGPGVPSGVGEDTYFFYKALRAGYRLRYEPSSIVWHEHRTSMDELKRQLLAYSRGHIAYHLHTLLRHGDSRAFVRFSEIASWQARSAVRALFGASANGYPLDLVLTEVRGNLQGPWALLESYARVRKRGRSEPVTPASLRAEPPASELGRGIG